MIYMKVFMCNVTRFFLKRYSQQTCPCKTGKGNPGKNWTPAPRSGRGQALQV